MAGTVTHVSLSSRADQAGAAVSRHDLFHEYGYGPSEN
jgi:hypothetical protein